MRARIALRIALVAGLAAFVYWVAVHTYWADEVVPREASGAALSEPFYAAQRLVRLLGAHATYERLWKLPPANAVVVTAYWDWDRSGTERAQLQRWVESGGRLVAASSYHSAAFSTWSGITRRFVKSSHGFSEKPDECRKEAQGSAPLSPLAAVPRRYEICGIYGESFLASTRSPVWQIADAAGVQALRVAVGRGSVTVVNGEPFTYLQFVRAENAPLFVAVTQLRTGDEVYFLSDQSHASLVALAWRFGAPVIALLLAALVLALWRAAPRFGPAIPAPESARRSLAEQIRGTGRFLLRSGDGQALHEATVRALFAAAPRRISAFSSLSSAERNSRLERETGFPASDLAAAINHTGARRPNELRSAIALLEAARRQLLSHNNRSTDGN